MAFCCVAEGSREHIDLALLENDRLPVRVLSGLGDLCTYSRGLTHSNRSRICDSDDYVGVIWAYCCSLDPL
jgi:hypothetical protein